MGIGKYDAEMWWYNVLFGECYKISAAEEMLGELPVGFVSTNLSAGPAASQIFTEE